MSNTGISINKSSSTQSLSSKLKMNNSKYPSTMQTSFNIGHEGQTRINDAKMDYLGTKLAIASSDKAVRIFAVDCRTGGDHKLAVLTGYDGPVWQLSWSRPEFGSLLATASYDGRIIIWKEAITDDAQDNTPKSRWSPILDKRIHDSSVNAVAWVAQKFGRMLAAASSDGSISFLSVDDCEVWTSEIIRKAHELGCQSVSWSFIARRFASGGNDYNVKIWSFNDEEEWMLERTLQAHTDWVYNVEWSPVAEILVSTGRDGRILLWTKKDEPEAPAWNHSINQSLHHVNIDVSNSEPEVWSLQVLQTVEKGDMPFVSWDPMGTFLCVSGDAKEVSIWKQEDEDEWKLVAKPRITCGKLSESFGV